MMTDYETFETRVTDAISTFAEKLLTEFPELRGLGFVLDWQGQLNRGAVPCAYFDKSGSLNPDNAEALTGAVQQTGKLLQHLSECVLYHAQSAHQVLTTYHTEIQKAREELPNKENPDGQTKVQEASQEGGAASQGRDR